MEMNFITNKNCFIRTNMDMISDLMEYLKKVNSNYPSVKQIDINRLKKSRNKYFETSDCAG